MPKRFAHLDLSKRTPTTETTPIPNTTNLSRLRLTIVNELWRTLNNNNDPASTPAREFLAAFEEERCPEVAGGLRTPKEMEEYAYSIMAPNGLDDVVTKENFFAFHDDLLAAFPDQTEKEVKLLVHWIWRLNQPDPKFRTLRKDELAKLNKELFQSSAYRGQKFQEQALNDDHVDMNKGTEPMTMLDPFHLPKPGILPKELEGRFYFGAPISHHRTHLLRNGEETLKNRPPFEGEPSCSGRVRSNPKSLGFIDSTTNNKEYGGGALDDNVVDAVIRGKESEQEAARRRAEVMNAPFATAEPPHFKSTTQMEHLDFNPVLDRESDKPIRISDKEWSQHASDLRAGNRGLRRAGDGKTAPDALPAELSEMEKEIQAKNRRAARGPPSFDMLTTQREHFAALDFKKAQESNDRWAEHPTLHAAHFALQATATSDPRLTKEYGSLSTEYSDNMLEKKNADFSTKYHHPGVLDLKNGTHQMKTKWHHPRDDTIGQKNPDLKASTVVPRQFATTTRDFNEDGSKGKLSTLRKSRN